MTDSLAWFRTRLAVLEAERDELEQALCQARDRDDSQAVFNCENGLANWDEANRLELKNLRDILIKPVHAAAPELLWQLKHLVAVIDGGGQIAASTLRDARAAIASAEGGAA